MKAIHKHLQVAHAKEFNYNRSMQWHVTPPENDLGWAEISNIKTIEAEKYVYLKTHERTGLFYYTLFDFNIGYDMEIIKVSSRVKTTAINQCHSLN